MDYQGTYLSFDQDWAPSWATRAVIDRLESAGQLGTLFVTNQCDSLELARSTRRLELGWHPNFLPGSTHGESETEVLQTMAVLAPDARGVRAHCLVRSTPLLLRYGELGLEYEASDLLFKMANIQPLVCWNRMVRLPIFWEDDVHIRHEIPLELDARELSSPGLKIFNFHPILVALNAAGFAPYEALKVDLTARGMGLAEATREDVERYRETDAKGVGDYFDSLLDYLVSNPTRAGGKLASLATRVIAERATS